MVKLSKPIKIGSVETDQVEFRPLTVSDVVSAREVAEKIYFVPTDDGPTAVPGQSPSKLSFELLRRQLVVGGVSPVPAHVLENLPADDLLTLEDAVEIAQKKSSPQSPSGSEQ